MPVFDRRKDGRALGLVPKLSCRSSGRDQSREVLPGTIVCRVEIAQEKDLLLESDDPDTNDASVVEDLILSADDAR